MPGNRKELALVAASRAAKLRRQSGISATAPINIYDFCEKNGVSVLFQDIPSMEGIYMSDSNPRPSIIVSSLRPIGRKAMTCGHELGHHVFGHGRQWDELIEERNDSRKFDPDEYAVDIFSSCLQMPKAAVAHAFQKRGIEFSNCSHLDIFNLSCYFGVSYKGFIQHLESTLNLIKVKQASIFLNHQPKDIREEFLGQACPQNLVVSDFNWVDRTIDVEIGDSIILPTGTTIEGNSAQLANVIDSRTIAEAKTTGISRACHPTGWCAFIRVSRKNYVGRAPFRFEEEVEDED